MLADDPAFIVLSDIRTALYVLPNGQFAVSSADLRS